MSDRDVDLAALRARYEDTCDPNATDAEGMAAAALIEALEAEVEQAVLRANRMQAANREHIDRIDELEAESARAADLLALARARENEELTREVNAEVERDSARAERDAERAKVEAVAELAANARRHAGGPFTAHVDVLSLERALGSEGT